MAKLVFGYLFRKKNVTYNETNREVFEALDYVAGILFISSDGHECCNILTGNNAGKYADDICSVQNESELVIIPQDFYGAIEKNGKRVDFLEIREDQRVNGYFFRTPNELAALKKIKDEKFLKFLNKKEHNGTYDDDCFEKSTDISIMYDDIKKTIISQDEQIMEILTALFKNQKLTNSELSIDLIAKLKENVLIYGPTGTGKTEILKRISSIYNIPIVIEDATSLSETGYQGRGITDMLSDLCLVAKGDKELAQRGILVIDEFDKLAEKGNESHVSRFGVQRSLLKLLDGSIFYFNGDEFDTSKLTIVAIGAFTGINKRDDYKQLTIADFEEFGIMRELIGRFSKTVAMNKLEKEDMIEILKNSDFSPLNTYKQLFEMLGVEFEFDKGFIKYIAELAIQKNCGARSLKIVFDDCISSALFRIFAGEYSKISLVKPNDTNDKPYILTKSKK